jgi:anti-anti-sigma regulatory factor
VTLSRLPARDELRTGSLTVHLDLVGGVVRLTGVLDRATAHLLHDAVSTLLAGGPPRWQIDAEGLVHCDGAGLRALSAAYRRALLHDRRVGVSSAPPWLCSALGRIRLDSHVLG